MVQCDKALLHIRARTALFRTADENAHVARIDFVKECLFLLVRIRFVDKGDLFFRNAHLHELVFQVVVCVEVRAVLIFVKPHLRRR